MAFFRTPGIERLYSGVTKIKPFDFCSFSRKASQSAGGAASRSWLKNERPLSVTTSIFSGSGVSLASAFAIFSEKLSLRRLPTMVRMWWGMGCPSNGRERLRFTYRHREMDASASTARKWKHSVRAVVLPDGRPTASGQAGWCSSALVRIDQEFFAGGALGV